MTDFNTLYLYLDKKKQKIMKKLADNYPNKLELHKLSAVKRHMFKYKDEAFKSISKITSIKVFFYLSELPVNFTDNFSIE